MKINLTDEDKRKILSYSSLGTLHECPRKFEIYRAFGDITKSATIDTAFGSAVGAGIQSLLDQTKQVEGLSSLEVSKLSTFLAWDVELDADKEKAKKSLPDALLAVSKFYHTILPDLESEGWELAHFNGKPATELSFILTLPDRYFYRGYVDAVLVNKSQKRFRILEIKTTGLNIVDVAAYKNSFQGIGYGIILDKMIESYEGFKADYYVDYLVYKTATREFLTFPFLKSDYQRARWLFQLKQETKIISMFIEDELFPMNGESCYKFYRQCPYFGSCENQLTPIKHVQTDKEFEDAWSLDTNNLSVAPKPEVVYDEYDFIISYEDLIDKAYKNANIEKD